MSVVRRSLQVVAFICTLVVGVASMTAIITQTTWFKEWLRGFIVRESEDYVNGRLSIGRLGGNLFYGVELGDVEVTMNGKTVVAVEDVGLNYNAFSMISGDVVLDSIRLTRPTIRLERTAEGTRLSVARVNRGDRLDIDGLRQLSTTQTGTTQASNPQLTVLKDVGWLDATHLLVLGSPSEKETAGPYAVSQDASTITDQGEALSWNPAQVAVSLRTQSAIVLSSNGQTWRDQGTTWVPFVRDVKAVAYPG